MRTRGFFLPFQLIIIRFSAPGMQLQQGICCIPPIPSCMHPLLLMLGHSRIVYLPRSVPNSQIASHKLKMKYGWIKQNNKLKMQPTLTFHFNETSALRVEVLIPGRSSCKVFLASLLHGIKLWLVRLSLYFQFHVT